MYALFVYGTVAFVREFWEPDVISDVTRSDNRVVAADPFIV